MSWALAIKEPRDPWLEAMDERYRDTIRRASIAATQGIASAIKAFYPVCFDIEDAAAIESFVSKTLLRRNGLEHV